MATDTLSYYRFTKFFMGMWISDEYVVNYCTTIGSSQLTFATSLPFAGRLFLKTTFAALYHANCWTEGFVRFLANWPISADSPKFLNLKSFNDGVRKIKNVAARKYLCLFHRLPFLSIEFWRKQWRVWTLEHEFIIYFCNQTVVSLTRVVSKAWRSSQSAITASCSVFNSSL